MTRILMTFLVFIVTQTYAQSKVELIRAINSSIENKAEIFNFFDKTGYLEQYQGAILFRFKLSEISSIKEKEVEHNFIVTVACKGGSCFSVIKGDSSNTAMDNNSYFFSNQARSGQFAKSLHKLSLLYQPEATIELSLIHDDQDQQQAEAHQPMVSTKAKEKDGLDNYLDEENQKETQKKSTNDDDDDEEKKAPPRTQAKPVKTVVKEVKEDDEDEKPIPSKKKTKEADEDADDVEKVSVKRSPIKSADDKEIGLANDDNEEEDKGKDEKNSLFCKQLHQIIQSGLTAQFKNIEGTETNTKTKINESKLKLKGAKRSYLSWYKKQRAFIAEIKTSKDFDLLQVEYDELQTRLENCLGSDWDFTDKSTDDEYADFTGEVRDTEYKLSSGPSPTLHIILISDGDKYTLFIRIR